MLTSRAYRFVPSAGRLSYPGSRSGRTASFVVIKDLYTLYVFPSMPRHHATRSCNPLATILLPLSLAIPIYVEEEGIMLAEACPEACHEMPPPIHRKNAEVSIKSSTTPAC